MGTKSKQDFILAKHSQLYVAVADNISWQLAGLVI